LDKRKLLLLRSIIFLVPVLIMGCALFAAKNPTEVLTDTPNEQTAPLVEYRNTELGFSFSLPVSWEGFSVQTSNWEGLKSGETGDEVVEQGLTLTIVHPKSTAQQPRQDIPLMVFTIEQWDQIQSGAWHIGAAPIAPLELGRNSRYVFALPARYNYAFLEGWEEVEQIVQGHPLVTFEPNAAP
jgi:hypothetical protein